MSDANLQIHRCDCQGKTLSILRPATLAVGWFRSVLDGREYPRPPFLPDRPPVVADVGANIGISTLYFALRFAGAKIWAFEPSRVPFHCLRQNTASFPNVTPVNVGLFSADRRVTLHHGRSCVTDSVMRHHHSTGSTETVELRRASELLAEHLGDSYISILKVDTEGCELPILRDLAGWYDRIDCLYYEYHSDEDRVEVDRMLSGHFYVFHAQAQCVHRGTVGMIAKRLESAFPAMNQVRIASPKGA
jgi:FkbM family methyltransferase